MTATQTQANPRSLAPLLSFATGYVDAAVFVHMGGLFVAHVTGNFVLLGAAAAGATPAEHDGSVALQLISFPVFFLSAFLAALLSRRLSEARATRSLLLVATLLMGTLGAAAALPLKGIDPILAMGFAASMGIVNATHRLDPSLGPPFTVMTGNVTALAVFAARAGTDAVTMRARGFLVLVATFALGCLAGAIADHVFGLSAMLVPAAILLVRLLVK